MFLSRSVDEKPLYDRILLMLFSSTFAIEESELRILFCQWSNINFMFRCLGIKLPPWRTLETNSNTIIKLLEDEKRLRWKFNGRVFVVGRDLHLHYPLGSLPSPRSNQRHRTSHITSDPSLSRGLGTTSRACCQAPVTEVREIIIMPRGGRGGDNNNKTIRYNYNHVVSFQDCCLLISTPRHNYMLLPPASSLFLFQF